MPSRSFKTSFRVVRADTDAAQVAHYPNYFRFFERTEEEFYRQLGFTFTDAVERGPWFPRVEACCQYKSPARSNDLLEVELTIEELKEKSVKYKFKIINKENLILLAIGYLIVVAADRQTGKATVILRDIVCKLKLFTK